VNSTGSPLSQADFAMSKISVNETYGGNTLRKAIDYFCHTAVSPEFYEIIRKNDPKFAESEYFQKMAWLKYENDNIYDPAYTDMLRVAFTKEFKRGKLQDLVALISGRNFETKAFEDLIVEESFSRLKHGIITFMNETNFKNFIMIIRSAGFVDPSLIGSQIALNSAYILYLTLRDNNIPTVDIERFVRKWFVFSILTGRYSGSPESMLDLDIRQIHNHGFQNYSSNLYAGELSDAFWSVSLPQEMDTSVAYSQYFRVFVAAQVKLEDKGFLSSDISIRELVEIKSDVHHLFPRDFLKKEGFNKSQYNQIANFAICQSEINIAIGNKEPGIYLNEVIAQCDGGPKKYGNIVNREELKKNFAMNCIPEGMENMTSRDYQYFLEKRRFLMAQKIKTYFERL
jgi:hypothetical protein